MDHKWRTISCNACIGGIKMTAGTEVVECDCSGGLFYVRPSGHLFSYPGGPARGRVSPARWNTARALESAEK